jgi:tRNA(Leu) C34 or U34 (ribose-2'-O)-methylase TrmL
MQVHDSLAACLRTLPQACNAHLPHPPRKGAPKVGDPLSSKLDVELTQGTNESLCELFVNRRLFAFTTKAVHHYHEVRYQAGDAFLFGPESRGLPAAVLESIAPERRLRLPMLPDNRSLNLSNTVAVAVFEAWRQCDFAGSQPMNSLPG